MDIPDLAYAAGIIDGEGCITIAKSPVYRNRRQLNPQYQLRVAVVMTDPSACKWLHEKWPGGFSCLHPERYNSRARKTYAWNLTANKAASFLGAIRPFLKIKHRQAMVAIQFQTSCIQRIGLRIRDEQTGRFAAGNDLQSASRIRSKESAKALISRLNQSVILEA